MPTGTHRPKSRVSLVWVFAGVTALLMVAVAGYAFLRGRPATPEAVPVFAGGVSASAPAAVESPVQTTHSVADRPYLDLPANNSGRLYFHLGSPTSKYSDFIEFTVGSDVFNGNTTRVDAFVLKIAMRLHAKDGFDQSVGESQSVFAESRAATFARFKKAVPAEFDHLAQGQDKILSPGGDPAFRPGGKYAGYFKPVSDIAASDILGCAGPLSGQPDQCASLNRHGTNPATYYKSAPANYYAKFWHDNAIGHRAYGFPYDDVNAQSTYVSHRDPQYLLVAVGF